MNVRALGLVLLIAVAGVGSVLALGASAEDLPVTSTTKPEPQAEPPALRRSQPEPLVPCSDPRGCPDLVVDPGIFRPEVVRRSFAEEHCAVQEDAVDAGERRLLLFDFGAANLGVGDLIVGLPSSHPEWFVESPCHGHRHFKEYADYRLWRPADFERWNELRESNPGVLAADLFDAYPDLNPLEGRKQGFCMMDISPATLGVPKFLTCEYQGISAGWQDIYSRNLDGQWIDITDVASGEYILEGEVNAEWFFEESDYDNNRGWMTVAI